MFFLTKSILYCYCDIFYLEIVAYDIFYFEIVPCDIFCFEIVPRPSSTNIRNYHYLWNTYVTIFTNLRNTCRQQKVSDDYEKELVRQEWQYEI